VGRDPIWPELYELRNRLAQGDSRSICSKPLEPLGSWAVTRSSAVVGTCALACPEVR
jgi:hypothetical protein